MVTSTSAHLGASFATAFCSHLATLSRSRPGTSRRLTLATAWAGITVLAPSPTNPPRMPWISRVGSAQVRSNTE